MTPQFALSHHHQGSLRSFSKEGNPPLGGILRGLDLSAMGNSGAGGVIVSGSISPCSSNAILPDSA